MAGLGFKKENLSEKVRKNFVGIVVYAEYPCNCPICRRGNEKLKAFGRNGQEKIHIVIKPLNEYDKLQHAWYPTSNMIWSNFGAFVVALNDLLGFVPEGNTDKEQWENIKEYLMSRAFEWTSMNSVQFVSQVTGKEIPAKLPSTLLKARENWFPMHEFSKEEVEKEFGIDFDEEMEIGAREVEELFKELEAESDMFSDDDERKLEEIDQIGL